MKISITAKPNSKKVGIEIIDEKSWIVRVREQAVEGKANSAISEVIAEHFQVPKSKVILLKGEKSKHKIFEIGI